ncbi:exopolysaccharide biosynthesis protein VpsH [Gangjinia marincola]|uniref:Exopolysaccharide biosynthesis protein VpsH n=1 Tax=Gangjinia marincola TaxID=578463 RepID=A0ABN1MHY6_9FLAO
MNFLKSFLDAHLKYGFLFKRRLKKVNDYYTISNDKLEQLKQEKIRAHIENAYTNSLFYKKLYDDHGVNLSQIQNQEDVKNLPPITKAIIKDQIDKLYIGNRIRHTSHTSGTSGSPLKVYYDLDCVLNEAAHNEVFRNNAGHHYGQKVVSLRGVLDKSRMKYFDKFSNTLYLSSYNLSSEYAKFYLDEIERFKPNAILAYPSSLEILSNFCQSLKRSLNVPVVFTSSETLYDHQKEKIEKMLNTKIFDRYGNAERTISLVQFNQEFYEEAKLYSYNEYKENHILTTNLINPGFPLIRYRVDDQVEIVSKKPIRIQKIIGRVDDYVVLNDGSKIGRMDHVFKGINNVKYAQIIQDKKAEFDVNLVIEQQFNNTEKDKIIYNIKKRIGDQATFNINFIHEDELIKTSSNKFKLVISRLE